MSLIIAGRQIDRVAVIEDNPSSRESYEPVLQDLSLTAVLESGSLPSLEEYLVRLPSFAQAAVCDHHLKHHAYAAYNGAPLVARCYKNHFPALLFTNFDHASIDEMRPIRRFIPVLLSPRKFEPDIVLAGLQACIDEFDGTFSVPRRPWRTLVRILEPPSEAPKMCYVVVPAWDPREVIRLSVDVFPVSLIPSLRPDARFHALVNLGADSQDELYFDEWEER